MRVASLSLRVVPEFISRRDRIHRYIAGSTQSILALNTVFASSLDYPISREYFKHEVRIHFHTDLLLLGLLNRFAASKYSAQRKVDRLSGIQPLCHRLDPDIYQGYMGSQHVKSRPPRKLGERCKSYPFSRLFAHLEGFLNEKLTTPTKQAVEVHNLQYPSRALSRPRQHLTARTWIRIPMGPRQVLDLRTKFRWPRQLLVGCGDFYYQWSLQCCRPSLRGMETNGNTTDSQPNSNGIYTNGRFGSGD